MLTGIDLPPDVQFQASPTVTEITPTDENPQVAIQAGIWTPPQYGSAALTTLSVKLPPFSISRTQGSPVQIDYVFDAVFRLVHSRKLRKTSHPVLTGANISDHAYIEPARVSLEIGMSDSMASFSQGVWTGFSTKSISAWQVIKDLQVNKTLITLTTRLDVYINMLIIDATTTDDNKTRHALKAHVVLEELLSASVESVQSVSARDQSTGVTVSGVIQPMQPNTSQLDQYEIPSIQYQTVPVYPQIPGAGHISSNPLSRPN